MERPEDSVGHLTTEELFRRHAGFVTRFLARFGVPAEHLEDAVQEVFLVVHRNGGYRPGVAKPTSYLANIAIRAAAEHRRRQSGDRKRRSEAAVEGLESGSEDPAHALQVRQDLRKLQGALDNLTLDLRAVLVLVEIEGESCLSVAAGLGCPVGTVYWRLHEARKQLQSAVLSVDVRRRWRTTAAERNQRALPARSMIMLFGWDRFSTSEARRLLELAREPSMQLPVDAMLEHHQQLVASGAKLPAWAASYVPHTASWLGLLGAGPIALGATLGGAALAVALVIRSEPALPAPSSAPVAALESGAHSLPGNLKATENEPHAASSANARQEPGSAPSARAHPSPATTPPSANAAHRDARALKVRGAEAQVARRTSASSPASSAAGQSATPAQTETAEPHASGSAQAEDTPSPARRPSLPRAPDGTAEERRAQAPDTELTEMREIARAESLLRRDPARALALTRALQQRFPDSYFREERAYVEVMALSKLERTGELRDKAASFLRVYPNSPYTERVKVTVGR